jgi:hypothetical protein
MTGTDFALEYCGEHGPSRCKNLERFAGYAV